MSFNKKVTLYSFVLTVFVIWVHSIDPLGCSSDIGNSIQLIFAIGLGQIAVPGFFCMSGYLFFRNFGKADDLDPMEAADLGTARELRCVKEHKSNLFSAENRFLNNVSLSWVSFYLNKWKKRIHTLIIPYLLWNLFYYAVYVVFSRAELGLGYLAEAVICAEYNTVFWYMGQLIVITFLTPVLALFLKSKISSAIFLIFLIISAVFYDEISLYVVNEDALFYYFSGAVLAVHFKRLTGDTKDKCDIVKMALPALLIVFLLSEYVYMSMSFGYRAAMLGTILGRISGAAAVFLIISLIYRDSDKRLPEYMRINFFVYAAHYLEIRFVRLLLSVVNMPEVIEETLVYLLMPAACIALSYAAYKVLKKFVPNLYMLITGGRS